MSIKLALKNLQKSFKDYAVYFLTIAFGVCLFYVFNSIDSQESMIKLGKDSRDYFKLLTNMINGMSIFVAVVLAFLVIYANKFLIKRRKKELSVYMLLGMEKRKISSILVYETLFTGIIALAVGLFVGIFISQGLAVVIANMFKAKLKSFEFTFSSRALTKTLLYFGLIFVIVMIFNVINITKCKLINLINSDKKNEKGKIRNFTLSMILFVISIICIIFAYNRILKNAFMDFNKDFKLAIIFGTIGTYFALPLIVAVCHSVVGIKAIAPTIKMLGDFNILVPALATAGIMIIIYGGYFLATYFSSKNIIMKQK